MTNSNKLKGRIYEKGYNLTTLAEAMAISRVTLRSRLGCISEFKVSEIQKICTVLDISISEVGAYFFS